MNHASTRLAALVALGTALAMPLALAQSAVTPEVREAQEAATQDAGQDTRDAAQDATTDSQPAARQMGWADVDTDGNGSISRAESAALPGLAAVFDQADADADGELTADEYRAHAAAQGEGG